MHYGNYYREYNFHATSVLFDSMYLVWILGFAQEFAKQELSLWQRNLNTDQIWTGIVL